MKHRKSDKLIQKRIDYFNNMTIEKMMKRLLDIVKRKEFIFKNRKEYRYWKYKKNGMKTVDETRGPGYYLNIAGFNHPNKGMKWESPMKSGKTGIYELIDY